VDFLYIKVLPTLLCEHISNIMFGFQMTVCEFYLQIAGLCGTESVSLPLLSYTLSGER